MNQMWSIPVETTDWLVMKVQLYVVAQLLQLLNHSVLHGGINVMDFY